MIQNVLFSSFTPLKNKNEINCWENRPFATVWPERQQQETKDIARPIRKKEKRVRTAFTTEQLKALEKTFSKHKYICSADRAELARTLNIGDKCVKIWFQNRRMKEKRESYESSNDSSSDTVSMESASVPGSPPLQEILIEPIIEKKSHNPEETPQNPEETPHSPEESPPNREDSHNPDSTYQLPTYQNTNEIQSVYGGMAPPAVASYFYNENTLYPTQYFPYNVNYSIGEGNGYNQYGSEINNHWTGNQYQY